MSLLSSEAQEIKQALREEIEEYGLDDEQIAAVLNAAADRLPTSSPHEYPSQIFYNGSAMAANLLREWAAELKKNSMIIDQALDSKIIINGITYIKEQQPDHVKFWYLHDNHTFTRLEGSSLDEIAAKASALSRTPAGTWGSLCPAILMCGHKEVRRVGPMVHAKGANDSRIKWKEGIQQWIKTLSADQDIMRILAEKDQSSVPRADPIE